MNANSKQVAGTHYAVGSGYQHWDIVVDQQLNYFEGQITKYVMRARKKNGMQDLEKAAHFLQKYMEVYSHYAPVKVEAPGPATQSTSPIQCADENFAIEGYMAPNLARYKCKHCGWESWATGNIDATQTHGSCAGRGYVAQG